MKAARIHAYGAPEALVYEEAPDPVAGEGEMLVTVEAAGINPADYKFRRGDFAAYLPLPMPLTLGMDIAGRVLAVGKGVEGYKPGDAVLALLTHAPAAGYAEKAVAPAGYFAHRPEGLDAVRAAALPTPGLTGAQQVEQGIDIKAGQRILVTGATGAVGRAAVFAAKRRGAHVTAGVKAAHKDAVPADADAVLVLDDNGAVGDPDAAFDAIADTVGGTTANGLLKTLKPGGLLSTVSTIPVGDPGGLDVVIRNFTVKPDSPGLRRLAEAVASGALTMPPIEVLPLSQAAQAHRRMEAGGAGKLVLAPGG